jgi:hypothetical protein
MKYHLFPKPFLPIRSISTKTKATGAEVFKTLLPSWLELIISLLVLIVKILLDMKNKIGYEKTLIKPRRFEVRRPPLFRGFFIWNESQNHEGFCLAKA